MRKKLTQDSKFFIQTFGCSMNYSDTERFDQILTKSGLKKAKTFKDADLLIFNTCSVRQKAEDRVLGLSKIINKLRIKNPNLITVLSGCMARRTWDEGDGKKSNLAWHKELYRRMGWLDHIIETKNFPRLIPELFNNQMFDNAEIIRNDKFYDIRPKYRSNFQAFLPISTGCDHFCSYCIVPFARGREVCRSYESILEDFTDLVHRGYKDITLVGQIVNRWINPLYRGKINAIDVNHDKFVAEQPADFVQLLRALLKVKGDYWLTYTSSHPMYFSEQLVKLHRDNKKLRPFLHFAMQSGNDRVLSSMKRDYTYDDFKKITDLFYKYVPTMALTTDVIVGFPGETYEEFLDTCTAMDEIQFDMAYLNEYSPRIGTRSAIMNDNVPHKEKERRKFIVNNILEKSSKYHKASDVGKTLQVLPYKTKKLITYGRTIKNREVMLDKKVKTLGNFIDVKITDSTNWALKGTILNSEI